ncbi:MAG TPA: voltage-dependent potassium channel subunit beta [Chloroflexi bacterium]|nr:MAG: aldo/keto reductase [Chloroflexota bacterium]HDD55984.1 voltage-dependent potassium channel subunit beta [Chloroflexota bacterium]
MEYRSLGRSGLKVSTLSFGSWVTFGSQVDVDKAVKLMTTAYDAGVNFFDNAEVYSGGSAERIMGEVIKKTGWKRHDLVLSTKIFWGGEGPNDRGLSRKHIIEGLDASLGRMGLDYVDLVYAHRPDIHTPIEETVRAFNHVINQGKAFYWGTSEWSAQQIMEAYSIARQEHLIPPLMEQPQYNMFHRERVEVEYHRLYSKIGLGTTVWSPLASGLLTGKYNNGIPKDSRANLAGYEWLRSRFTDEKAREQIQKVIQLAEVAKELGCTTAQLALAWCTLNPHVSTVITGASKPSQVAENLKALQIAEQLTPDVVEKIEEILDNKPELPPDLR